MKTLLLSLFILLTLCFGESVKILVVLPMPSRSHYNLGSGLAKGLAEAGHEVTIMTPFSEGKVPKFSSNGTYREIVLENVLKEANEQRTNMNMFDREDMSPFITAPFIAYMLLKVSETIILEPKVQDLLNSGETFDVVIVEEFLNHVHKLFANHFKAKLIIFSPIGANSRINNMVGNPAPLSYIPEALLDYSTNMSFFERVYNSLASLYFKLIFNLYVLPKHKQLAQKYFPNAPDLEEVLYNPSIVLLNSHVSTNIPVPMVPNMIDIGGFHIQPPKELPHDLKKFLDDAPNGVIYFSMGSNLKSAQLPIEKRNAILRSFSKLKQKILWKFEEENIELPPNVMIKKWFPQSDLLAHKNIKLFITHGGLLSTTETIYHGVPILAIPIFGDQKMNAQNAVMNGFGLALPYRDLTEENLTNALIELLNNPKYHQNAVQRSKIFHDRLVPPMETAVYWVEYVARNPNSAHLRVAGVDLPWYKYLLLDVVAFVSILSFISIYSFAVIIKTFVCKRKEKKTKKD